MNYSFSIKSNLSLPFILRYFLTLLFVSHIFDSALYGQQKTLGVTKHLAGSTETGYILFAPMYCKTTYLIDKCGKQVHSWKSNYSPGLSVYLLPDGNLLRTGISEDTFFRSGANGGIIEKIDWDGNVVWSYIISNDSLGQHHDIYPMDNGNILVIARHVKSESEAIAKGRKSGTMGGTKLYSERIIEIKPIGTNEAQIIWQWTLWDHIIQDASFSKPDYNVIGNHPELMNINYAPSQSADWIHINAIDYNKELDQILITCHNLSEVWILDHSTTIKDAATHSGGKYGKGGDILYRWGNPAAYNKGAKMDQKFFLPHNAYWIPKGYKDGGDIMIFNNGLGRFPAHSSVEIITPTIMSAGVYNSTLPYGPSSQKWIYKDPIPENFFSGFISGASRLSNGNTLVCVGLPGKFFELDDKNNVVWEYINPVVAEDEIGTDGEAGGNSVFRITYYAESYNAFKGKNMTPSSPIEKNSYSYSCSLTSPDITAPKPIAFLPVHRSGNVAINASTAVTFSEKVFKGTKGYVSIYEKNQFKEAILISDSKISVNGKIVSITPANNYSNNSRISISIDKGCFKDSTGNEMVAFDSLNWAFNTVKAFNSIDMNAPKLKGIYPNPTNDFIQIPFDNTEPKVQILNSIGQIINCVAKLKTNKELEIDLSEFADGIYSILLNGQFSQFIVKE